MATISPVAADPADLARSHGLLRFAVGTTAAFVLCEWRGWYPTFLAPLLAGVLLSSLPRALPIKAGIGLVLIQAGAAIGTLMLSTLLRDMPFVLFGSIGLILFLSFAAVAHGGPFLPILLLLIAMATVPIATIMNPEQAGALPQAFIRGMIVAVVMVWIMHAIWPRVPDAVPPEPKTSIVSPVAMAATGTLIVLPLMLVYLMYGLTDALPVLITTVVLVVNLDPKRSAMQGLAMMVGNFLGGMIAILAFELIGIAPSLLSLALVSFIIALLFAIRMDRGGPSATVGLITFNQTIVLLSLALMPGPTSPGLWMTRLVQFGIACLFAIGMMTLVMPRVMAKARPAT